VIGRAILNRIAPAWAGLLVLGAIAWLPVWAVGTGESIVMQGNGSLPACSTCHGTKGEGGGDGLYPRLAGLPATYIENQLRDFRDGARPSPLMSPMAAGLTDATSRPSPGIWLACTHRTNP